jgi:HD superfamily phosphohydrolase
MHLASQFLTSSLRRADEHSRKAAQEAIKRAVAKAVGTVSNANAVAEHLDQEALVAGSVVEDRYRPYVQLAEQALRLAALFHDLGHLPFSHDFEFALEQLGSRSNAEDAAATRPLLEQGSGLDALHERLGHNLALILFQEMFSSEDLAGRPTEAARVTFEIASEILNSPDAQTPAQVRETGGFKDAAAGAFAWLHTLIAGELDVDRCDYVLRDARSYGFEFAYFDHRRLIDNLVVVAKDDHVLLPAVRPNGYAAVESFLIARARMYQWGPRHHKVAQIGSALRYAIAELLRPALVEQPNASHPLSKFVTDLETILEAPHGEPVENGAQLLDHFGGYDDQWWMNQLREYTARDEWLDLVCWRQAGPKSLWKRAMDFPEDLAEWNRRLPGRSDTEGRAAWDDAVRGLRDDGVLVIRHSFEPWKTSIESDQDKPESVLSFYDPEHGLVPVSRASYLIRELREAWLHDVQVHASARSDVGISAEDVVGRLLS